MARVPFDSLHSLRVPREMRGFFAALRMTSKNKDKSKSKNKNKSKYKSKTETTAEADPLRG